MAVEVQIDGGASVRRIERLLLQRMPVALYRGRIRATFRIGEWVTKMAKWMCPISPTKGQYESLLRRKKQSDRNDFHPGQLTAAITFEHDAEQARVFVPSNSKAGVYANYIHYGDYNLGIGSILKGPQVGPHFISRAIQLGRQLLMDIFRQEMRRALREARSAL